MGTFCSLKRSDTRTGLRVLWQRELALGLVQMGADCVRQVRGDRAEREKGLARVSGRPGAHEQQHFSPIVCNNHIFDQVFSMHTDTHINTHSPTDFVSRASASVSVCVFACTLTPHCRFDWRLYSCHVISRAPKCSGNTPQWMLYLNMDHIVLWSRLRVKRGASLILKGFILWLSTSVCLLTSLDIDGPKLVKSHQDKM